jgi:hypothetical protein
MEKLAVVSPLGLAVVKPGGSAPRLDTLAGKTIGEVWNGVFKGNFTFPVLRKVLQQKYPDLKIIPYTEFPHAPHSDNPARQKELADEVIAIAKREGCDALITGNGA